VFAEGEPLKYFIEVRAISMLSLHPDDFFYNDQLKTTFYIIKFNLPGRQCVKEYNVTAPLYKTNKINIISKIITKHFNFSKNRIIS